MQNIDCLGWHPLVDRSDILKMLALIGSAS